MSFFSPLLTNLSARLNLDDEIMSKLAGKGMTALVIKVSTAGLSYLMFMLLARWMSAAEYGYFATAFSLGSFLAVIAGMGQHNMVLRYLPQYEGQNKPALAHGMLLDSRKQILKGTLAVASLGLLVTYMLGYFDILERVSHFYWGAIFAIPMAWAEYQSHVLRACGSVVRALAPRDIVWRIILPLSCFIWISTSGTLNAEITMMLAAATLGFLTLGQLSFNKKLVHKPVQEATPAYDLKDWRGTRIGMWGSAVVGAASPQLSTVIVGIILSPEEAGMFFVALRTASLLSLPLIAINIVGAPLISNYFHSGQMDQLKSLLLHIIGVCIACGLLGYCFFIIAGEWLLSMFGEKYTEGYGILLTIAFGQLINVACGPSGVLMLMSNRERVFIKFQLIAEISGLLLMMIIIPIYGVFAASLIFALILIFWNIMTFKYIYSNIFTHNNH